MALFSVSVATNKWPYIFNIYTCWRLKALILILGGGHLLKWRMSF